MRCRVGLIVCAGATLGACASGAKAPVVVDFSELAGRPAPARGLLYVSCMNQAADAGTFRQVSDSESTTLLLLDCDGIPARAFYEALGPWSSSIGSQFQSEGRTYRSTAKVVQNLFGVDYCSVGIASDYRCTLSFNAGDFLKD